MGMYCKKCQYDLSHCVSYECPECGRGFDPSDSDTFLTDPLQRIESRIVLTFSSLLGLACVVLVVLPLFSSPSISYRITKLLSHQQTLRSQLDLYAHQHNGNYPTLKEFQAWDVLSQKTDINGHVGESKLHIYGPYVEQPIENYMTGSSRVAGPGQATIHHGWEYNENTHKLRFVVPTKAEFNNWGLDPKDAVLPKSQQKR